MYEVSRELLDELERAGIRLMQNGPFNMTYMFFDGNFRHIDTITPLDKYL